MDGKSIIVYYSWVGNTAAVAEEIKVQTGFDIQEIKERKERKESNIPGDALGAFFGFKSRIKPLDFELKNYNQVLLGAQIWAGKTTPAINTYLHKAKFKGKKVWLFITLADDKAPIKVIESMTKRIKKKAVSKAVFQSLCKPSN